MKLNNKLAHRNELIEYGKENRDLILKAIDYTDLKSISDVILEDVLDLDQGFAETIYEYLISDVLNITVVEKKTVKEFINIIREGIKSSEKLLKKINSSNGEDNLEEATKKTILIYKKEIQHYKSERDPNEVLSFYYFKDDAKNRFLNFIGEKYSHDEALFELKKWKEKLDLQIITSSRYDIEKNRLIKFIDKDY